MKDPVGDVCVLLVGPYPYLWGPGGCRVPIWGVFLTPFCFASGRESEETESGECYVTSSVAAHVATVYWFSRTVYAYAP